MMQLKLVPARTGIYWVKRGMLTFASQPLAMTGLFVMWIAFMSVTSVLPVVGLPLALTLLPAATLGLMAATREATMGQFPKPAFLICAFRSGRRTARAMLALGVLYCAGFMGIMAVTWLVDGGGFASVYLGNRSDTPPPLLQSAQFQSALWVFIGLHLPLSLTFWHAPALVYWHGITPVKSLFFSAVACWRNLAALTVFGAVWMGIMVLVALVVVTIATWLGHPGLAFSLVTAALLVVVSMFFTSLYFTFKDSLSDDALSIVSIT